MEAFLVSTGIVALAEMGDKTQLLSLVLAARFPQALADRLGILVATLVQPCAGRRARQLGDPALGPDVLRWVLGGSFIAMASGCSSPTSWTKATATRRRALGVFGTTLIAFFLAEMGDKTQVATVMLAAQFNAWAAVVAGTTLGMMLANVPVVWFGDRITRQVPIGRCTWWAPVIFLVLG